MRRTYAPSMAAVGLVLGGFAIYAWTHNTTIAIVAAIVCSILAFVIMRAIENGIDAAGDKLAEKASEAYQKHKEQKQMQEGGYDPRFNQQQTTQFPGQTAPSMQRVCQYCGNPVNDDSEFCGSCGAKIS